MMHNRKAVRLVGSPFEVTRKTAVAKAAVGVFTFGESHTFTTSLVKMQAIHYITSGKTATVPASEIYAPSEPDAARLRELPVKRPI